MSFSRTEWAQLPADALPMDAAHLSSLAGLNEQVLPHEVSQIYPALVRLLRLHMEAAQRLHHATAGFFSRELAQTPFVIGLAGSVAVGKSTFARILQHLLCCAPGRPRVDLVPTDGFLFPNRVLRKLNLMHRKGFPESYDLPALLRFVSTLKAGAMEVQHAEYSHLSYDVLPQQRTIRRPQIVILEGLNVLQPPDPQRSASSLFVSDCFDFSIYLDAPTHRIRQWYVERFLRLRETAFASPQSYFHRYASLSDLQARRMALRIWREINEVNLQQNILPTRERASLIVYKGTKHEVQALHLRKF